MYCYCNPNEGVYSCTIYSDELLSPPSTAGAWACRLQAPRLTALLEALLCSIDCSMRSAGFCSLELAACNSAVSLAFLGGLPSLPFGESLLLTLVLELYQLSRDSGKHRINSVPGTGPSTAPNRPRPRSPGDHPPTPLCVGCAPLSPHSSLLNLSVLVCRRSDLTHRLKARCNWPFTHCWGNCQVSTPPAPW